MVETRYAAVVDSYINLGDCYDREALLPHRQEIIAAADAVSREFPGVGRCLKAASGVAEQIRAQALTDSALTRLEKRAAGVISREFGGRCRRAGKVTKRFLSGVTPQGVICFFETAQLQCERLYDLDSVYGLGDIFLKKLLAGAVASGRDVVVCPDPKDPENRIEHLLVPELSVAFVSSGVFNAFQGKAYRRMRLDGVLEKSVMAQNRARLRFMQKTGRALVDEAVDILSGIKANQDVLESIYTPHVDAARVGELAEKTASELLAL